MFPYLSADIVCSSKLTVRFSEQIMSVDNVRAHFCAQRRLLFYCDNFCRATTAQKMISLRELRYESSGARTKTSLKRESLVEK